MNFKGKCGVCRIAMTRNTVKRLLLPCMHLLHTKCYNLLTTAANEKVTCPVCREVLTGSEDVKRITYMQHTQQNRERIVVCANKGEDWTTLATALGIKYKTAFHWVRSGRQMLPKGGKKPKLLTENQIDQIISWLEREINAEADSKQSIKGIS